MNYKYLFLVTTILYGVSSFLNRSVASRIHPYYLQTIIASTSVSLIPIYLYLAKVSKPVASYDGKSILIVILSTITSIVGSLTMFYAITKVKHPGSLGMMISLYPAIGMILSVIFLHETINLQKIIAICLMILGTILLMN